MITHLIPTDRALTLVDIFAIIVSECFNSCQDARSTYEYFADRNRLHPQFPVNLSMVKVFAESLNFAALRENNSAMRTIISKES